VAQTCCVPGPGRADPTGVEYTLMPVLVKMVALVQELAAANVPLQH